MATKAVAKKNEKPVVFDVLDEFLDLPEEYRHLCVALGDDDGNYEGQMRFLINREIMDIMRDISDELEMSRGLPVNAREVLISDPVVVWLLQNDRQITPQDALEKAVAWYNRQKQQVTTDALFVAFTSFNEFNIAPVPYKDGELAFDPNQKTEGRRTIPAWMKNGGRETHIPLPERRLTNKYEMRLKQLFDIANMCGAIWTNGLMNAINQGMAKTIRLIEPTDDAGFPPVASGS